AQDSLWAGYGSKLAACASPATAASLAGCFSAPESIGIDKISAVTTDGVNVYFATLKNGGWSCPIAGLGTNCTHIMAGAWPSGENVKSLAAADGMLWIGQNDGEIYRCAANIPYASQSTMPDGCVLLDDAETRSVDSLLLANGRLYAGLAASALNEKSQGILWSCDPQAVNSCENLDYYGTTVALSLAAGGGYLWAGLDNGIIWRCNLDTANHCDNWEKAGGRIDSVSYDGRGTLYAAVEVSNGVIWSCPTASANGCSTVLSNVAGSSVAAGAGGVFSSTTAGLYFGASAFTAASDTLDGADLLYVPARGMSGVGDVAVTVRGGKWTERLGKRCASGGGSPKATVRVTGPHGLDKTQVVNLCRLQAGGSVKKTFTMLDPGAYTVTARTKKVGGSGSFTVEKDRTGKVTVRMTRAG
ncbi:MAG: hypothetical protein ACR2J8_01525, partial [Thermomicrobiales bacterium]